MLACVRVSVGGGRAPASRPSGSCPVRVPWPVRTPRPSPWPGVGLSGTCGPGISARRPPRYGSLASRPEGGREGLAPARPPAPPRSLSAPPRPAVRRVSARLCRSARRDGRAAQSGPTSEGSPAPTTRRSPPVFPAPTPQGHHAGVAGICGPCARLSASRSKTEFLVGSRLFAQRFSLTCFYQRDHSRPTAPLTLVKNARWHRGQKVFHNCPPKFCSPSCVL